MRDRTKQDLRKTLVKLLEEKPLKKITVTELSEQCGISRMTFYYHFKDIYDLLEWTCVEELSDALNDIDENLTWQEGVYRLCEDLYKKKIFVENINKSLKKEVVEEFWQEKIYTAIEELMLKQTGDAAKGSEKLELVLNFYKYGFAGIMLDWVEHGMKDDYKKIAHDITVVIEATMPAAISAFLKQE